MLTLLNKETKNLITVYAMRRSGHHAISEWILYQFDSPILFFNCVTNTKYSNVLHGNLKHPNYNAILVNHETKGFEHVNEQIAINKSFFRHDNYKFVLILRDPLNNWASTQPNKRKEFEEIWISHAKEFIGITNYVPNKICINYNMWFTNECYREELYKLLEANKFIKQYENVPKYGSSFDGNKYNGRASQMKVLDRWKHFRKNPQFIKWSCKIKGISDMIFGENLMGKITCKTYKKFI